MGDLFLFAVAVIGGALLLLAFVIGYWINRLAPKDPLSLQRNEGTIEAALTEAVLNARRRTPKDVRCPQCQTRIAVEEPARENTTFVMRTSCECGACKAKFAIEGDA